jgi:hypothetical protein
MATLFAVHLNLEGEWLEAMIWWSMEYYGKSIHPLWFIQILLPGVEGNRIQRDVLRFPMIKSWNDIVFVILDSPTVDKNLSYQVYLTFDLSLILIILQERHHLIRKRMEHKRDGDAFLLPDPILCRSRSHALGFLTEISRGGGEGIIFFHENMRYCNDIARGWIAKVRIVDSYALIINQAWLFGMGKSYQMYTSN